MISLPPLDWKIPIVDNQGRPSPEFQRRWLTLTIASQSFSAFKSGGQSISANTFTKIIFDDKEWDIGGIFDNVTNSRFQPTTSGKYLINANVRYLPSVNTNTIVSIYKNGVELRRLSQTFVTTSSAAYVDSGSSIVDMNGSTDYIELYFYQGVDTSFAISSSLTFFQGHYLG